MWAEIVTDPRTFEKVLVLNDGAGKRVRLSLEYLMDTYCCDVIEDNANESTMPLEIKNQILSRAVSNIKQKLGDT